MMYPEVGATISGGGFSNFFTRPDYQSAVVPAFLRHLDGEYDGWFKYGFLPRLALTYSYHCNFSWSVKPGWPRHP